MRLLFAFLFIPWLLTASTFETLMGKGTASWNYVETVEDQNRIALFKTLYEKAEALQGKGSIPKTLHFIWLGPKPFPVDSISPVQKWIDLHPGWKVKLWTDQKRLSLPVEIELIPFSEFPLFGLTDCYFQSDNFGERSELLRYSILLSEGGFYIDHDLLPLKNLDEWQGKVDFLCGLEPLQPSIMSSSVIVGTSLIGSAPGHPILQEAVGWLTHHWSLLETRYPGNDSDAIYNRVMHRSKRALDEGIQKIGLTSSLCNLVLPAPYFNSSDPQSALNAIHLKSPSEEKGIQTLLQKISSRVDKLSLLLSLLGALNLLAAGYLFFAISKKGKPA